MSKNQPKGREGRLALAQEWVLKHRGKPANMLKAYRKHFGVDWECAIKELQEFGIKFDEGYLVRLRSNIHHQFPKEQRHQPISKTESDIYNRITIESDAHFAYIAGYTPGGASYGISREEINDTK